jgi:hypothetical protein
VLREYFVSLVFVFDPSLELRPFPQIPVQRVVRFRLLELSSFPFVVLPSKRPVSFSSSFLFVRRFCLRKGPSRSRCRRFSFVFLPSERPLSFPLLFRFSLTRPSMARVFPLSPPSPTPPSLQSRFNIANSIKIKPFWGNRPGEDPEEFADDIEFLAEFWTQTDDAEGTKLNKNTIRAFRLHLHKEGDAAHWWSFTMPSADKKIWKTVRKMFFDRYVVSDGAAAETARPSTAQDHVRRRPLELHELLNPVTEAEQAVGDVRSGDVVVEDQAVGDVRGGDVVVEDQAVGDVRGGDVVVEAQAVGDVRSGDVVVEAQAVGDVRGGDVVATQKWRKWLESPFYRLIVHVQRAAIELNTRMVKLHGFTPAELLLGFNPMSSRCDDHSGRRRGWLRGPHDPPGHTRRIHIGDLRVYRPRNLAEFPSDPG